MGVYQSNAAELGFVRNGATANWQKGAAYQGRYGTQGARVGVIRFANLRNVHWQEQIIEQVRLRLTFGAAGSDAPKTISLFRATRDEISGEGATMIGAELGSVGSNVNAYSNTAIITMNRTTNATVFANFESFLKNGSGSALVLYRNESPTSYPWSRNYLSVTAAALEITYESAGSDAVLSRESVRVGETIALQILPQTDAVKRTHAVRWKFGTATTGETLDENTLSAALQVPMHWLEQIPNSAKGEAQCVLTTYENGMEKAERTLTFTIEAPEDAAPMFTPRIAPEGQDGFYQYISGAVVSAQNAKAQYGAEIREWSIRGGEGTAADAQSTVTAKFQTAGEKTFWIRATDSRGMSRTQSVSCNVSAVAKPTVQRFAVERYIVREDDEIAYEAADYGDRVWVSVSAACDGIGGRNRIKAYLRYGPKDSGVRQRVELPVSEGRIALDRDRSVISEPISLSSAYEFTLCIEDLTGTAMGFSNVGEGRCNAHFAGSGYGVGVGCFSTGTKAAPRFNVAYPTIMDESLCVLGGLNVPGVTSYSEGRTCTGGRWLDGKWIYREWIALGETDASAVIAKMENVDTLIALRGQAVDDRKRRIPLPFSGAALHAAADAQPEVTLTLDSGLRIQSGYVEALYTRFGLLAMGSASVKVSRESDAFEFVLTDDGTGGVTIVQMGGAELAAAENGKVRLI